MVGMGFTMGKGSYSDAFSELFASDPQTLRDLRVSIADPALPFDDWGVMKALSVQSSLKHWLQGEYGGLTPAQWQVFATDHFRNDWMATYELRRGSRPVQGVPRQITTTWFNNLAAADQRKYRRKRTTGDWVGWRGDAEALFREAMLRTIDACFGERWPYKGDPPRQLPVDFRWLCGGERLDWWITWDDGTASFPEQPAGGVGRAGQMVVTVLTPGMRSDTLLEDWYADPPTVVEPPPPPSKLSYLEYAEPHRIVAPTAGDVPIASARGQIVVGFPKSAVVTRRSATQFKAAGDCAVPAVLANDHEQHLSVEGLDEEGGEMGTVAVVAPSRSELGIYWNWN